MFVNNNLLSNCYM